MDPETTTTTPGKGAEVLLKAAGRILRPLVRLLVSCNVPFQQVTRLLKQIYVEVASEELADTEQGVSVSRLSLVTGIHRKEIKRLGESADSGYEVPASIAVGARIVARWTGDARFAKSDGRPAPLALGPEDDERGPSFSELVTAVTTDVHPRSVLDELLRLGIVRVDDERHAHLLTAAFVPHKGFDEKVFYLGRNIHDHLDVAGRNVGGEGLPLLERSVHYGALPTEAVDELETLTRREGMKLLETVNRRAQELRGEQAPESAAPARPSERMNFGLYFYRGAAAAPDEGGETRHA